MCTARKHTDKISAAEFLQLPFDRLVIIRNFYVIDFIYFSQSAVAAVSAQCVSSIGNFRIPSKKYVFFVACFSGYIVTLQSSKEYACTLIYFFFLHALHIKNKNIELKICRHVFRKISYQQQQKQKQNERKKEEQKKTQMTEIIRSIADNV